MALVVALVLVAMAGSRPHAADEIGRGRQLAAASTGGVAGSMSPRSGEAAVAVAAVEPGQPVRLVRAENQHGGRWLAGFLVAVVVLLGAFGCRRARSLMRVLELGIRARTELWRPAPGRRAPPPSLAI